MKISAPSATGITWHWSDGSSNCGATWVSKTLTPGTTNTLTVDPPEALLGLAVSDGAHYNNESGVTKLISMGGLADYPNLQELHLYMSGLTNVSLAGCSNLVTVALVGTLPTNGPSSTVSQWLIDLDGCHTTTKPPGSQQFGWDNTMTLYYPYPPALSTDGQTAHDSLINSKQWTLVPWATP